MAITRPNLLTDAVARKNYAQGVKLLKAEFTGPTTTSLGIPGPAQRVSTYDLFVVWHHLAMSTFTPPTQGDRNAAHRGPVFCPWHRFMLRQLELNLQRVLGNAKARACALGEVLSEPKPGTWFERNDGESPLAAVVLDRRTRMLYDDDHVFINGESFRASGRDARLMRRFADRRRLEAVEVRRLGARARALLARWAVAGWCTVEATDSRSHA